MPKPIPEKQRVLNPAYYRLGIVADPAPDLILDKVRLARLKLEMLEQEIGELRNQIKLAETYRDMIREQHGIK